MVNPNWPLDVFYLLQPNIFKFDLHAIPDLFMHRLRDAKPVRLRQAFEPGSDIDTITMDVISGHDYVTEVYANTQPEPEILGHLRFAHGDSGLNGDGTMYGLYDTAEFCQKPITHQFDSTTIPLFDFRADKFSVKAIQAFDRILFCAPNQARITDNIGREDS